jgi:mannose-6-phosphate isomerase-like protein (cupin superfamily)
MDATVLVRTEQSDDRVGIVEVNVPAGWPGPPLHHHAFDEAFYVLEGELTFQLGDELASAGPGSLTFAPAGSHHTLANLGDQPARYLLVCTPGGFERYFAKLAAEAAGIEPPPEVAKGYPETTVVGPPIGDR